LSATSDVASSSSSQLSKGDDHVGVVVVTPVFWLVGALEMGEVAMGACHFESEPGLGAFFSGPLHSLGGLFSSGFPDADLVFGVTVADDVGTYAPVVVLESSLEDGVVHIVVAGEGGGEPDRHLGEGEIGVFVVRPGRQDELIDRESFPLGPFGM
jgi:hypothetical protein